MHSECKSQRRWKGAGEEEEEEANTKPDSCERVRRCTNGSSVAATGTKASFGEEAGKEGARLSGRIGRRASKHN
jgi:hypothetical protein